LEPLVPFAPAGPCAPVEPFGPLHPMPKMPKNTNSTNKLKNLKLLISHSLFFNKKKGEPCTVPPFNQVLFYYWKVIDGVAANVTPLTVAVTVTCSGVVSVTLDVYVPFPLSTGVVATAVPEEGVTVIV